MDKVQVHAELKWQDRVERRLWIKEREKRKGGGGDTMK